MKLKDLKKGDLFALREIITSEKQIYVRDEYDRSTNRYIVYKYDDINSFRLWKGDKVVVKDFAVLDTSNEIPY